MTVKKFEIKKDYERLEEFRQIAMQSRYEKVGRTDKDHRTGKEREPIDKTYYICRLITD